MNTLLSILGAITAISIIIIIHEFGHYWVARRCNVFVEQFSIGFGPCLYSRKTKSGLLFRIGCLPIGGYVKMQGDEYGSTQDISPQDYLNKPVWQRMSIILAGPFINFLLAILLYSAIYLIGFPSIKPIIKAVRAESIAATAGLQTNDQIVAINGHKAESWPSATLSLLIRYGSHTPTPITFKRGGNLLTSSLPLADWQLTPDSLNFLDSLGITPLTPTPLLEIDQIQPNSPAANAKLKKQDKIIAINNRPVKSMTQLHERLQNNKSKPITLTVQRQQRQFQANITPKKQIIQGQPTYLLGFTPTLKWPPNLKTTIQYGPLMAVWQATLKTKQLITLNVTTFYKLLTGAFSFKFLGGPFSIFIMGGKTTLLGLIPYLAFIAYISVAIGFLNLLPIPGLDGGHFVFQLLELIKGSPIALKIQARAITVGISLLLILMIMVTIQDIRKFF